MDDGLSAAAGLYKEVRCVGKVGVVGGGRWREGFG